MTYSSSFFILFIRDGSHTHLWFIYNLEGEERKGILTFLALEPVLLDFLSHSRQRWKSCGLDWPLFL